MHHKDDLKQSANFNGSTISILEEKVKKIEENIISTPLNSESVPDEIVKKMKSVLTENKYIKEKIYDLEDRSRRNNLRINGLPEHDKRFTRTRK